MTLIQMMSRKNQKKYLNFVEFNLAPSKFHQDIFFYKKNNIYAKNIRTYDNALKVKNQLRSYRDMRMTASGKASQSKPTGDRSCTPPPPQPPSHIQNHVLLTETGQHQFLTGGVVAKTSSANFTWRIREFSLVRASTHIFFITS